jgi:hypothetical protein
MPQLKISHSVGFGREEAGGGNAVVYNKNTDLEVKVQ